MKNLIKYLYHNTTIGKIVIHPLKRLNDLFNIHVLSEKVYIKRIFKNKMGYSLNLDNTQTIQEKISWIQLYDRTPLKTLCTDRYAVRDYVLKKIGEKYLVPLICNTKSVDDILPVNLPEYPFIIKTNHARGNHIIVREKSTINWEYVQKKLKRNLKKNYYYKAREWQYKNIEPCILVEKLLLDENSNIPTDYKLICYNGKVTFIQVISGRMIDAKLTIYTPNWEMIQWKGPLYNPGNAITKPKNLSEMKSIAETLAEEFKFVRVDLYNIDGRIYFGEMTFSPVAGFESFPSQEIAKELNIKFNL